MPLYFCGDTSIDNYEFYGEFKPLAPQYSNWNGPQRITVRNLGGVYLLALFTAYAWSLLYGPEKTRSGPIRKLEPASNFYRKELLTRRRTLFKNPRAFDHWWQFSYQLDKCGNEYRIPHGRYVGVTLPTDFSQYPEVIDAEQLPLDTGSDVKTFIINYRKAHAGDMDPQHQHLAKTIASHRDTWTIIKVRDPPMKGEAVPLLSTVIENDPKNVIVVIQADEFRKRGLQISRSLSWERTLRDVIREVRSGSLLPGNMPVHLIITFDYDAALYLQINSKQRIVEVGALVYSVGGAEGEFESRIVGSMPGAQSAFVSMFSTLFYKQLNNSRAGEHPLKYIGKMLGCSLIVKRRHLQSGFAVVDKDGRPFMTRIADKPVMPSVFNFEGVFSLRRASSSGNERNKDPSANKVDPLADPFIGSDGSTKTREFLDPLDSHNEADLQASLGDEGLATYDFQRAQIPKVNHWPEDWSIFRKVNEDDKKRTKVAKKDILEGTSDHARYVMEGITPKNVPICSFGKIMTIDVQEIEDFRTIANLLQAYLSNPSQTKPLGIAVFGPAGAGKSFAVKNIVKTLPPDAQEKLARDDRLDCNLTALSGPEDLANYFQLARNSVLRGKVPMLFFDEFDCTVGNSQFFWLKHFLAPLQDGEFRSGQIVHPIGRVIFVFAGSVCDDFKQFRDAVEWNKQSAERAVESAEKSPVRNEHQLRRTMERNKQSAKKSPMESEQKSTMQNEPSFKGVDFLSRLHGHIDIINFTPKATESFYTHKGDNEPILVDPSYLMRRAFVLRSLLEQYYLSPIFSRGSPPEARIDVKIVNALLATRTFRHGVRSMESILRMSYLEGADRFEISHLPPNKQLKMHVDVENFDYCLGRNIDQIWLEAAIRSTNRRPARHRASHPRRGRAGGRGRG